MTSKTFFCIDSHTCGCPVRVVVGGAPTLEGKSMAEYRVDFRERYDWIRRALMLEPRGHDMMSGTVIYPPHDPTADLAFIFIETSGCLPMCGHGTIGTVTVALESGLVPWTPERRLRLEVPAGCIEVSYKGDGQHVDEVRLYNIGSFLHSEGVRIDVPELGELSVDVAYGGNFYAIVEPQAGYTGLDELGVERILRLSPGLRAQLNDRLSPVHPLDERIRGISHVLWADKPKAEGADGRNAVFAGDRGIDRSPCGTGTSARMAQLAARGELAVGESYMHESIIGSLFNGRIEAATEVGDYQGILPSIGGWARVTGHNTIFVDSRDPFAHGFQLV